MPSVTRCYCGNPTTREVCAKCEAWVGFFLSAPQAAKRARKAKGLDKLATTKVEIQAIRQTKGESKCA